ncbi:2-polyprenyl-6-methoxyphenol hydroxylase-like FAD-dependent oxidoreductase [Kribbella sp. VKM Ac-2571]|uniref:FAD-dependent monooxygenase n=1 Tax=Kribbella sp. VKM Ac-2571 TaxID=2512222 RepID=UPI0010D32A49|nr:FAD-dependent monooxygenase [Kribbella sp. VKM Ac-2571]TDO67583.1 2-polyprenyl-6-methoxyphenol hydroxylase-like FAD-dependent oxidoreductase [Kribbella sp. VKM Ac-2571]
MTRPRVLVVGAGPTGLALALQAHASGAAVRVIDRRPDAARPSRAMMMHARTLEVLRPLGVVESLLEYADRAPTVQLHLRGRIVRVKIADLAVPDTAYPHLTLLPQARAESVLAAALVSRGVPVERGVELAGLTSAPRDAVRAQLRGAGSTTAAYDYLVGCDGADSTVRQAVDIGWTGGDYDREVVQADIELDGGVGTDTAHVATTRSGLVFLFPHGDQATWRLLATRAVSGGLAGDTISPSDVQEMLDAAGLGTRVGRVAWSELVPMRHRLADRYRNNRVFLAGDAAHVHSPAGGQGMNTGIQDAINLGWKLARAANAADPETLLDSYELERRPVARTTTAWTNLVFWAESGLDPPASLVRTVLLPLGAPLLVPSVLHCRQLTAAGFRILAQLRVRYPDSRLSIDDGMPESLPLQVGERLPDLPVTVADGRTRLQTLTARPGTHVLLLRDAPTIDHLVSDDSIQVHRLLDRDGHGLIAVRPDGYIGLRTTEAASPQLARWLSLTGAV